VYQSFTFYTTENAILQGGAGGRRRVGDPRDVNKNPEERLAFGSVYFYLHYKIRILWINIAPQVMCWDMTPCSLVKMCLRYGETRFLHPPVDPRGNHVLRNFWSFPIALRFGVFQKAAEFTVSVLKSSRPYTQFPSQYEELRNMASSNLVDM
jgi:hypothetical protein